MLSTAAVPAVAPSRPSPSSAVPGMAWIPAATVEWYGNAPIAAGGWLGTSGLFRGAARRVLDRLAEVGALPKGLQAGADAPVLVCMPNEGSMFLTDHGDERPVTLTQVRQVAAELDAIADNRRGLYSADEVAGAEAAIRLLSQHLAAHGLRLGVH